MIEIVIPMAGAGSRFKQAGYTLPKPFIDVAGKMMIEHVLDSVQVKYARYTLIIQERFLSENEDRITYIKHKYPVRFATVKKLTQGASCTALAAHKTINLDNLVVFVDSDNIFDNDVFNDFIDDAKARDIDGSLLTFPSKDNKFSYAEIGENGFVINTKEKETISKYAIAGAYLFKKASYFFDNAIEMLIYGDKTKNEYYMSNVFNYAISNKLKIGIYEAAKENIQCVGTPELLKNYLKK